MMVFGTVVFVPIETNLKHSNAKCVALEKEHPQGKLINKLN